MWLSYGVDATNTLIGVENVPSGKTDLKCPYCWGELIAKKGRIMSIAKLVDRVAKLMSY